MKNRFSGLIMFVIIFSLFTPQNTQASSQMPSSGIFTVENPDKKLSPYTGMTREHWLQTAEYLLQGAFSYINSIDDPMKFPKQFDKTYPHNDGGVVVEKLEGLCRTLFVANAVIKEYPDYTINNIKVADYYRHQILNLINPESPSFVKPRGENQGPSQTLVEFGGLAISLTLNPEVLWDPFTQEQKDLLAKTMISYGEGPTVNSNWRFFNIFVLSFFKDKGYEIKENVLKDNLEKALGFYRAQGWYNDSPAYDYYSMWAFQMYGPVWANVYGKYYPEYANKFMSNLADLADNYPYMFDRDGKMNMWGRSIAYRFGAIIPMPMLGLLNDENINYGWMRRISSASILQFLENPDFMEDNVPTLGFYKAFEPSVQIYSCRGSVYWCGKAFLALTALPKDNIFWTAKENNGPWEKELKKNSVNNIFQDISNLLITNYPNIGASEMRSWCHETVAGDWQKFRSGENYNKLAYNTAFPWMADGNDGEVSMNYAVRNDKNEWEVLRLYTFKNYEDNIYRRDAVLETNRDIKFQLTDIILPNGILRVDKLNAPKGVDIRMGHYSLPENGTTVKEKKINVKGADVYSIYNGEFQLAMQPYTGWKNVETIKPEGLHPVTDKCAVQIASDSNVTEEVYVTMLAWKNGDKKFNKEELGNIKSVNISDDKKTVEILFNDKSIKTINFD